MPAILSNREVVVGESWEIGYTISRGGVALDLSAVTVTVTLQIRNATGGVVTSRSTLVSGETRWPSGGAGDGSDGQVEFLFDQAATSALAAGSYDAEIVYVDTGASPSQKKLHARGRYAVSAPRTGAI